MFDFFSPDHLWFACGACCVVLAIVYFRSPAFRTKMSFLLGLASPTSTFTDLLLPTAMLTLCVYSGFWWHTNQLRQQRLNAEEQARGLQVKADTIRQELETNARRLREFEHRDAVPQLLMPVKELEVIGSHVDASWRDPSHNRFSQYVIELESQEKPDAKALRFLATDSAKQLTRIPENINESLPSGLYWWRVGALTERIAVDPPPIPGLQDPASSGIDWSPYRSFEVFSSIAERIRKTNRLLVGTNFQQATQFSRRSGSGVDEGLELSLVKAIVEGCTAWYRGGKPVDRKDRNERLRQPQLREGYILQYDKDACSRNIRRLSAKKCRPEDFETLPQLSPTVEIVPVGTWGAWEQGLIHKEVDAFTGELTRTLERERAGIRFSSGYYSFHSSLIVRKADADRLPTLRSFRGWCSAQAPDRTVGVIENTTNMQLAVILKRGGCRFKLDSSYGSYPQLENAMDGHAVDSIIVDYPLAAHRVGDWYEIKDFTESSVYRQNYLRNVVSCAKGECRAEEFGIATVEDDSSPEGAAFSLKSIFDQALANPEVISYLDRLKRACSLNGVSNAGTE